MFDVRSKAFKDAITGEIIWNSLNTEKYDEKTLPEASFKGFSTTAFDYLKEERLLRESNGSYLKAKQNIL